MSENNLIAWKLHNTVSGKTLTVISESVKGARQIACDKFSDIDWADPYTTTCDRTSPIEFLKDCVEALVGNSEKYRRFPLERREFVWWIEKIAMCLGDINERLKKLEPEPPKRQLMKDLVRDLEQEVKSGKL